MFNQEPDKGDLAVFRTRFSSLCLALGFGVGGNGLCQYLFGDHRTVNGVEVCPRRHCPSPFSHQSVVYFAHCSLVWGKTQFSGGQSSCTFGVRRGGSCYGGNYAVIVQSLMFKVHCVEV